MAKIIHCKYLPVGRNMDAMALWPFIIVKKGREKYFTETAERHEKIHLEQQKELLLVGFYVLYAIFWIIGLVRWRNLDDAYQGIPFEQEAYINEKDSEYLKKRKRYGWREYI